MLEPFWPYVWSILGQEQHVPFWMASGSKRTRRFWIISWPMPDLSWVFWALLVDVGLVLVQIQGAPGVEYFSKGFKKPMVLGSSWGNVGFCVQEKLFSLQCFTNTKRPRWFDHWDVTTTIRHKIPTRKLTCNLFQFNPLPVWSFLVDLFSNHELLYSTST